MCVKSTGCIGHKYPLWTGLRKRQQRHGSMDEAWGDDPHAGHDDDDDGDDDDH